MSEYPRPAVDDPKPFKADGYVGLIGMLAYAAGLGYELYRVYRADALRAFFQTNPLYSCGTLATTALFMGLFAFLAQSRRAAFWTLFGLLGLVLLVAVWFRAITGVLSPAVWVNAPLWAYCAARLFGRLGPRPIRRAM